jgi:hypothetical protein
VKGKTTRAREWTAYTYDSKGAPSLDIVRVLQGRLTMFVELSSKCCVLLFMYWGLYMGQKFPGSRCRSRGRNCCRSRRRNRNDVMKLQGMKHIDKSSSSVKIEGGAMAREDSLNCSSCWKARCFAVEKLHWHGRRPVVFYTTSSRSRC